MFFNDFLITHETLFWTLKHIEVFIYVTLQEVCIISYK